jgi:hypothetical protein
MDGWIKKGGATPDRSRTPSRGPLFGPNVLPYVRSEREIRRRNIKQKKTKRQKKKTKGHY